MAYCEKPRAIRSTRIWRSPQWWMRPITARQQRIDLYDEDARTMVATDFQPSTWAQIKIAPPEGLAHQSASRV